MRKPIQDVDFFIYYVPMHGAIGGFVTPNPDGTFSVYLNERLSRERNLETMEHEIGHIIRDDFYTGKDVAEIEGL